VLAAPRNLNWTAGRPFLWITATLRSIELPRVLLVASLF
jgi:hypothetical protein